MRQSSISFDAVNLFQACGIFEGGGIAEFFADVAARPMRRLALAFRVFEISPTDTSRSTLLVTR
jgi:hypothetical protein